MGSIKDILNEIVLHLVNSFEWKLHDGGFLKFDIELNFGTMNIHGKCTC